MSDLLPGNSTPFERAMSLSTDVLPTLLPATVTMRGIKFQVPPASFLPFLEYEFGLGAISGYFTDPRVAISEGLAWQRILGTPGAINKALGWINYAASIEPFPVRRKRWNLFMLAMAGLPAHEEPDLNQIEDLAGLSAPLRSKFWRGFRTYDIRAVEYGYNAWGSTAWSNYSGARIHAGGAKWSFGRDYQLAHSMTQAELTALGVWIAPSGGSSLTWGAYSWAGAAAAWVSTSDAVRLPLMASGVLGRPTWIVFRDSSDAIIGYRRARVVRGVALDAAGQYSVNGIKLLALSSNATSVYVEAMTDFGDGYGHTAAKWSLLFDAVPVDTTKPGLAWAGPGELTSGTETITTTQTIEFRRTVRERFRVLLNF
jgi:hypothetical protein